MIPLYYKSIELIINAKIKLDPTIYDKLSVLDGTRVDIVFSDATPSFGLCIKHHGILVREVFTDADVSLEASTVTFAKIAVTNEIESGVHISGDASLGRQVEKLLTDLDLDFTGKLAEYIGLDAALCVSKGADRLCSIRTSVCDSIRRNVVDYVANEDACVVSASEMQGWSTEVDDLRKSVDVLEQRITNLSSEDS